VRAAAITAGIFTLLSFGPRITIAGHKTGIPGPWTLVDHLPLFNAVVPTRLSLVVAPIIGLFLALAIDRFLATTGRERTLGLLAVGAVLLPLLPAPMPAKDTPHLPAFIAQDIWRDYVPPDRSLVMVPLSNNIDPTGIRWAARSNLEFAIAGGYFLGPGGNDGRSIFGAPVRQTEVLFRYVARTGDIPRLYESHLRNFDLDLRYWRAAVLVVSPAQRNADALRKLLTRLLGPGQQVGGVWLWDVRERVDELNRSGGSKTGVK
jgi:hypothetical protein